MAVLHKKRPDMKGTPCCGEKIKFVAGLPTCPKCGTRLQGFYREPRPTPTIEERYSREYEREARIGDPPGPQRELSGED